MGISIQPIQIIWIIIILAATYGVFKLKKPSHKVFAVIAIVLVSLFNPIRFKQEGVSKIERFNSSEIVVPEKVVVERKPFSEKQSEEMDKLKTESKESVKNEID